MIGVCRQCRAEVEILDGALVRHGGMYHGPNGCPGSYTWNWDLPSEKPKCSAPGIGKRGIAPCGHEGEHVTAFFVVCYVDGCDGYALGQRPADTLPIWTCRHSSTSTWNGTRSCVDCGKVL